MSVKFKHLRENMAARLVSMAVKHTTPKRKSILTKEEPEIGDGVYLEIDDVLIETEIVDETEDGYVIYIDEDVTDFIFGKDTMDSLKRIRQSDKDKNDPKKTADFWNKQLETPAEKNNKPQVTPKKVSEDANKYMDTKPVSVTAKQASEFDDAAKKAFKPKYYEPDNEPAPKRRDWDYGDEDVKPIVQKYLNKNLMDKKPLTAPNESVELDEAEYQGRDVPLNKPMSGDVAKSKVYVKGPSGRVVKVNFGDKNLSIKKHIPARRRSFRARHHCETPGPKHKARYWSCKAW